MRGAAPGEARLRPLRSLTGSGLRCITNRELLVTVTSTPIRQEQRGSSKSGLVEVVSALVAVERGQYGKGRSPDE